MTDLIWDMAHPVGSVMQVANGFDPNTVRGTWERIEGRFLLASSGSRPRGSTGGEAEHKLTVAEMPAHAHVQYRMSYGRDWVGDGWEWSASSSHQYTADLHSTESAGGGQAHNNMPPYLAVDTWRRVA